jgi:hypothetical protein
MSYKSEQLTLPLAVRPTHEVFWFKVREVEKRRLIGKTIVEEQVRKDDGISSSTTVVDVDAIDNLTDPDLRYALRFRAAADQAGWQPNGPGETRVAVSVYAIDEGADSRFMGASYDGVGTGAEDTFLRYFYRFAPDRDENH